MPMTPTELAIKGAEDLQAWLTQTDIKDAMVAFGLATLGLAQALGEFIQLMKEETEIATQWMDDNNDILDSLRAFYSKVNVSTDKAELTKAEIDYINEKMALVMGDKFKPITVATPEKTEVPKTQVDNMINATQAKGEQISADLQLTQSTLTSSTSRYQATFEQVTTAFRNVFSIGQTISGNYSM